MSLYGHEISDTINVFEAGLDRWLKLDKGEFIGRQRSCSQEIQSSGGPTRKLIGLEMVERGIARDGYPV
jgi:aminomethyltransferase